MIVKSISVQPLDVKKKQDGENPMVKGHNREENVPSLHQEWRHFKEETSLHGLKFATRNGKYRIRWLIWTLAFLASLGTLIYTLTGVFYDFKTKRTISNIAVKQVEELPFPAVTICPMSPYKRSHLNLTDELERYYLSISRIGPHLGHIVIDYSDPIYQEPGNETFLDQASFQTSDILYACLFDNIHVECDQLFEKKMTEMGLCFTMNSYDHVSKYGQRMTSQTGSTSSLTLYIMIDQDEYVYSKNVAAGYKVTIHDPEEEPNVMNMAFLTSPGFSVNAAIRMKKYSYLSYPYKAVGDKYCLETRDENFRNTLKYFPTYSEYGCTRECKRDYVVSKCGCRSHFDPGQLSVFHA
ncbi:hypothetical protein FSP39_020671 [Pinctada imbricata]|uniref:Uncharacterized protein n=1 Tax=Pinctada imbricata TaxID=66713 RepID=A0AA89BZ50_PINIB|nr:hypothetical protein FSP39_020671 [Pinctada imbricata]